MWTQQQLKDAISAVVTQKMRFTQASVRYNIPKGTLYDNILGKSNRMQVLEEAGLDATEENAVLEFCCDVSVSPYNRRTKKSLASILDFVQKLKQNQKFQFFGKSGFRWWWAFCKKYSIVSLHYDDSYQYQLQSMWQKCWNTNQNIIHHLRFRERGPLKSWRPETMAEAIFSVLKEGLSLSQAARKYDIPYPTFVLYANRVHNMLGPSIDGGTDLRPKGRGRPQRILLGIWPDDHIRGVIKTVVFRDAKELKDEGVPMTYARHSDGALNYAGAPCTNGLGPQPPPGAGPESMSPDAAAAAAVAAVAHGIRQQIQMAAAAQHHPDAANLVAASGFNLPAHLNIHPNNGGSASSIPMPKLGSPATPGQMNSGNGSGAIPMPRHGSPAGHGLAALSGLHGLPGMPNVSVSTTRDTVSSSGPASSGGGSSHGHMSSPLGSGGLNITRLTSPGSAHDLRMASPDDNSLNSSLEMALEPAVNLAVGVSGMSYKSRGYTSSPRPEHLFQEDISDIVGTPRSCPSRLSGFKESNSGIKLEPVAECRSE
ncbi:Protein bric-a-brac 1 [Sergentomyia squamirostris]